MERSYDERGNEEHDYNELSNLKDTHAEESAGIIEKLISNKKLEV